MNKIEKYFDDYKAAQHELTSCCMAPLTNTCVGTLTAKLPDFYNSLKTKSLSDRTGLPDDVVLEIFIRCAIPDFLSLCHTNRRHYVIAQELLLNRELKHVQLCPKLTILNPYNFKVPINLFKVLKWYHKLEPTVENGEGLSLQIRPQQHLRQWIEDGKDNGVEVKVPQFVLEKLEAYIEVGDVQWEMMSCALIYAYPKSLGIDCITSFFKSVQREGYDQNPPVEAYLHLIIYTQKVFGKCLFAEVPKLTYGRTSMDMEKYDAWGESNLFVGGSTLGKVCVRSGWNGHEHAGLVGLKKL